MKASESFKRTIEDYLRVRANTDELFAKAFGKPGKSIDECVNFILNTVRASGCNGFEDDEIYSIAVHYYDEDNLDTKYLKPVGCSVVVNHKVTLTEEEKAGLEEKARKEYYDECMRRQRELNNKTRKHAKQQEVTQLSLF